jgi:hypothetical protein
MCTFVLAGCGSSDHWDKEYLCRGREQSTTHLQGHPLSENYEKNYSAEIDFHIRGDSVLVKSHQVAVSSVADRRLSFQTVNKDSSENGTFDARSGALTLQERRSIVMDGTPQDVRILGEYVYTSI